MATLPEEVSKAWEDRKGPIVLVTVNGDGIPNAIFATCVSKYSDDTIVVANNYFSKTLENILAGSKATLLFLTKEQKSYQLKGSIEYHKEGPVFDDMKKWNPEKHPGHAAAALKVEEAYTGAEKARVVRVRESIPTSRSNNQATQESLQHRNRTVLCPPKQLIPLLSEAGLAVSMPLTCCRNKTNHLYFSKVVSDSAAEF